MSSAHGQRDVGEPHDAVEPHLAAMGAEATLGRFPLERGFTHGVATYALDTLAARLHARSKPLAPHGARALLDASYNLRHFVGVDRFAKDPVLLERLTNAASAPARGAADAR